MQNNRHGNQERLDFILESLKIPIIFRRNSQSKFKPKTLFSKRSWEYNKQIELS